MEGVNNNITTESTVSATPTAEHPFEIANFQMKPSQPLMTRQSLQSVLENVPPFNGRPISYSLYGHLLQRSSDRRLFRQGKQLHARFIIFSITPDNFLASKLIAFYSRCRQLNSARKVFDEIPNKNTFAFNALLISYTVHSRHDQVLELFRAILSRRDWDWDWGDVKPDSFTLSCGLKAMSEVAVGGSLSAGMIHCYVVKHGLEFDVFVGNGLVTCYSRCDDLVSARALFDEMPERDLVSWNSMISGYSQGGFHQECKDLYRTMLGLDDPRPDEVTVIGVLHSCAQSGDLTLGMEVHQFVIDNGIEMDLSVCNSIIAVYAKCASLDYAMQLFKEMNEKDEITYSTILSGYVANGFIDEAMKILREMKNPGLSSWNAVISGKVQHNQYDMVLDLVREMQVCGTQPDSVTISSILPAIPFVSHLKGLKEIHAYSIKRNSNGNIYIVSAMIDAYAKLGCLSTAKRIFDLADHRSVIVWTAIISGYASHGDAKAALSLFNEMVKSRTKPDAVIFTAVLSACAHAGLVDEAWEIFDDLLPKYEIEPLANHYGCMVSCLTRARRLSEAVEFVKKMPIEPTGPVWGALLTGASECEDIELAKFVCDHLFKLEPENPTNYIVLANLYSKAGRWDEAEKVREKMVNSGFKKIAGSSRVEGSGDY